MFPQIIFCVNFPPIKYIKRRKGQIPCQCTEEAAKLHVLSEGPISHYQSTSEDHLDISKLQGYDQVSYLEARRHLVLG